MTSPKLSILHDSDGVIVVDKPAGIPSTGRTLDDPHCLQSWLMTKYRRRRIWAVHQLDTDTTGVNVFVRRKALVEVWSERLRAAQKQYIAFVAGVLEAERYDVRAALGYCEVTNRQRVIDIGRPARSIVHVRTRFLGVTEVSVFIETGRTHQVRLHMEHLGHPVLGDMRYASPADQARHYRQALHAASVEFEDGVIFRAPIPSDLLHLREVLAAQG